VVQHLDARSLVASAAPLASLPAVYDRLSQALKNPKVSATKIAEIISEDASLVARLLRLVNSPFYGFHGRIETVSHAVGLVGTDQISELALATCVLRMFRGIPAQLIDMNAFWLHGLATGVAARVIGMRRGETNVERLFVAGILHDVGRLVMYQGLPDIACGILSHRPDDELMVETERKLLGFDHADVGGELLLAWNLPDSLVAAAAFHHRPDLDPSAPMASATIHLADLVVHSLEVGNSGEPHVPPLNPEAWERLGLPLSALSSILEQTQFELRETVHSPSYRDIWSTSRRTRAG